jgi:threonine synthase
MAAYAARAGLPAHVAFPKNVPAPFVRESRRLGAHVLLAEGSISDAGRALEADLRRRGRAREAFRLSTLKEPYRLEGKKTMGYELAPPWGPGIPDVVVYPTGGGTGLIGMWKAFEEMEALGWCDGRRPRMVSVQMRSCAPVVKAWERGSESLPRTPLRPGPTRAHGLRVPAPFADREILSVLRESGGCAVAVGEREMAAAQSDLAGSEGLLTCPEAAATLAALPKLIDSGRIGGRETVLLLLTGGPALYG